MNWQAALLLTRGCREWCSQSLHAPHTYYLTHFHPQNFFCNQKTFKLGLKLFGLKSQKVPVRTWVRKKNLWNSSFRPVLPISDNNSHSDVFITLLITDLINPLANIIFRIHIRRRQEQLGAEPSMSHGNDKHWTPPIGTPDPLQQLITDLRRQFSQIFGNQKKAQFTANDRSGSPSSDGPGDMQV